jgi:hypothetical protein
LDSRATYHHLKELDNLLFRKKEMYGTMGSVTKRATLAEGTKKFLKIDEAPCSSGNNIHFFRVESNLICSDTTEQELRKQIMKKQVVELSRK